ncbi:Hypothetical predicted protein [Pelobates cultripes]|uniref:Uncharacterized protein n=1 Tax=Pelobates cultripes TaxID=61616 RepID=A0AAD1SUB5_PELCU|nr:Hypothetical predicted protein [Pelobates cultripes]
MLQELRSTMRADFQSAVDDIRKEVQDIGTRMSAQEECTDELCLANNEIVDKIQKMKVDKKRLMEKLEDSSRRNIIRVRGVPETDTTVKLTKYLQQLFLAIKPDLDKADLRLDRVHQVPKPKDLAQDLLTDIVTRLHYYSP